MTAPMASRGPVAPHDGQREILRCWLCSPPTGHVSEEEASLRVIAPAVLASSCWMIWRVQTWRTGCACTRLHAPEASCRLVERLTDLVTDGVTDSVTDSAGGARACLGNLVCRLLAQVTDAALRLAQEAVFAALPSRGAARVLRAPGLPLREAGEPLGAVLDRAGPPLWPLDH